MSSSVPKRNLLLKCFLVIMFFCAYMCCRIRFCYSKWPPLVWTLCKTSPSNRPDMTWWWGRTPSPWRWFSKLGCNLCPGPSTPTHTCLSKCSCAGSGAGSQSYVHSISAWRAQQWLLCKTLAYCLNKIVTTNSGLVFPIIVTPNSDQ